LICPIDCPQKEDTAKFYFHALKIQFNFEALPGKLKKGQINYDGI